MRTWHLAIVLVMIAAVDLTRAGTEPPVTNRVTYRLPFGGTEKTYRVTLAAAPADHPDWLVASFLTGAVHTVNDENKGQFTETWNGLDDNFMPVPPGEYVMRGIYMPAEKWRIDGQYHSITAKFLVSPGDSWTPPLEEDHKFPPVHGHVFEPMYDVGVSEDGKAVCLSGYIENWYNPIVADLKKPIGIGQIVGKFPSHGRAGEPRVAFDGRSVWMVRFHELYCPSNPRFGTTRSRRGHGIVELTRGKITSDLTAFSEGFRSWVYVSEPYADRITVIDGGTGRKLTEIKDIHAVATMYDRSEKGKLLYALHKETDSGWQVSQVALVAGFRRPRPTPDYR